MTNNNTTANILIGAVIMNGVKKEFFRRALVRISGETSDIQKISEYVFAAFNSFAAKPYQYSYSVLNEDCCWVEINGNTTGLTFIISRKETKKSDGDIDFTDMVFRDCSRLTFSWLTDCETKIDIMPPSAKEILLDYISNKPEVIKRKIEALLPIVDWNISQAIRITKGDPNSEEIIEALNYYDSLKQNEKQD